MDLVVTSLARCASRKYPFALFKCVYYFWRHRCNHHVSSSQNQFDEVTVRLFNQIWFLKCKWFRLAVSFLVWSLFLPSSTSSFRFHHGQMHILARNLTVKLESVEMTIMCLPSQDKIKWHEFFAFIHWKKIAQNPENHVKLTLYPVKWDRM